MLVIPARLEFPRLPSNIVKNVMDIVKKGDIDALKMEHECIISTVLNQIQQNE